VRKKIGLGTWSWGNQLLWGYQTSSDNILFEAYREALNKGYSLIDTADSYGTGKFNGRSEKLLGFFLSQTSQFQKNKIQIATKLAPYPWRIGRNGFNQPYKNSLERLNNKLDIVQLHWSTAKYNPYQEFQLLNNLCDLNEKGFQFKIGLSNVGPLKLQEIINFLAQRNKKLHCVQVQFSLLAPNIETQKKVKEICAVNKIDFLAYSPLSFGLLCKNPYSKKVLNRSLLRNFIFNFYEESSLEIRYALFEIAQKRGVSQAQVAINWCCYQGAIPIVGSRTKSQVKDIAGVLKWNLSETEFQELDSLSRQCKKKFINNPFASK
tara:strand:+ start:1122 stop:2084 length:963 start_codon:yes stop_codon:yes gene_type:complete